MTGSTTLHRVDWVVFVVALALALTVAVAIIVGVTAGV